MRCLGTVFWAGTTVALEAGMSFPHFYSVRAEAATDTGAEVTSGVLPALRTAPPSEFGGPGNEWSPETLAVAAVADCLTLTFKALAQTRGFEFTRITCDVQGKLDRIDRVTSFTEFNVNIRLDLSASSSIEEARRLVDMARRHCLITNSLKAAVHYDLKIRLNSHAVVEEQLSKVG
jgi:organic hydroperoxide reductase OsmC/OhrA